MARCPHADRPGHACGVSGSCPNTPDTLGANQVLQDNAQNSPSANDSAVITAAVLIALFVFMCLIGLIGRALDPPDSAAPASSDSSWTGDSNSCYQRSLADFRRFYGEPTPSEKENMQAVCNMSGDELRRGLGLDN